MTRNEYSKAWNDFWRQPEIARLTPHALSALRRWYAYAAANGIALPMIGAGNQRMVLVWVDLDRDLVFDIAVYKDGMAEWYFRECRRELAAHADATNRVPWFNVPVSQHLDHFKVVIKEVS